jgi:hypothetical protein
MIKYENSTLKIYIRNISKFIPISIQLLTSFSCQQNRSRKQWTNSFLKTNLKLTKCVFRSCNVWKLSKELNMFLLLRITVMCTSCLFATSLQLLLPVIQKKKYFGAEIFNPQEKKSAKIKCHLFKQKPQKLPVIWYILDRYRLMHNVYT